ncbi:hypothetical protein PINS_up018738 [Pythium insidiosum]|nr:hypothetical protein PINS_up018738 [Pythium insidiosum]
MGGSTRDLYELQVKTANYEAMMQRFQLRKVAPDENVGNNRFSSKRLVIDKYVVNGDHSPLKRRRSWTSTYRRLLSWNRLWRQRHEMYGSLARALREPLTPQSLLFKFHGVLMLIVYNVELVYLPFAPAYLVDDAKVSVMVELIVEAVLLWDMLLQFNIAYADSDNRAKVTVSATS